MDNVSISRAGTTATAVLSEKVAAQNYEDIQNGVEAFINANEDLEAFVFDLHNTLYISSAGLRMFQHMSSLANEKDMSYKLVGLRPDVMTMFKLTGYSSVFELEPIED